LIVAIDGWLGQAGGLGSYVWLGGLVRGVGWWPVVR
jgi:hypothetical protein